MRENLRFLPSFVLAALDKLDYNRLYEVRLRADKPVRVFYGVKFFYLTARGLSDTAAGGITVTAGQISEAVLRAAEFSIYAVNNHLSQGFITVGGGVRVGVAGEVVYEGEKIKTQKSFSSLVVRVPHEVKGCADPAFAALCGSINKSTLLISPPGCGKTTILRDLCRRVSDAGYNTLLVDERSEIAASRGGAATLNVGINTDIVSGA
ncbi:MAG: stage III sporulation protein AA, partial [Firmicutes bacterium]|nr:stage III sporulation protein AA [Bacillota bacterium]